MLPPRRRWVAFAALTPLLVGFDLWSKRAAVRALETTDSLPIFPPWLSVVHAENPGAMFSSPIPLPVIGIAGVVGIVAVVRVLQQARSAAGVTAIAAALLTGGALGNLLDRVGDGTVTDFIRVSAQDTSAGQWLTDVLGTATWPIFNFADIWLVVGIIGLLIVQRREVSSPAPADAATQ